ncbi:MAG: acetyl/propionyl-CoA carboxylase alpha subunit [Hyphomicrobiaceae bacterium]|jgi:acetyl/propionyl-CoA carboxylase alpha subunit
MTRPITKLLIANRAEIAVRVERTAREMGIATVAVYADPDRTGPHVAGADQAIALGGSAAAETYLDTDKILAAAADSGADAIHPGYGFLSENAAFAQAVEDAGLTFVGPSPDSIGTMGDKIRARVAAEAAGVPVIPSALLTGDAETDRGAATELGFPVLVKAAAGGGGRGMRRVDSADELGAAIQSAVREAGSAFGDDRVYLEKCIVGPRHVEVQVFGDRHGHCLHLGERECSVQRRHQKVIEEAPSPVVDAALRERMGETAVGLVSAIGYEGAGTVEYVLDDAGKFFFLEMNTRLQVEHPVTEAITGVDLVRWQLEIAMGEHLPEHAPAPRGHAIECRLYAEDPSNGFLPTAGTVRRFVAAAGPGVRWDAGIREGLPVPVEFDPMLAKLTVAAPDRAHAIERALAALRSSALLGITTNQSFLIEVLDDPLFRSGGFKTTTLDDDWSHWKAADNQRATALAAALAALAARSGMTATGHGGHSQGDASQTEPDSPWDRIGSWRLGENL